MAEFHTYDPDLVVASFAGIQLRGYANGTFIEAERDEDGFTKYVGTLGDVARSKNLNIAGKVTFTLMAVSTVNDELYRQGALDELTGEAVGELLIKDLNGNTLVHAENAWIMKWPKIERGKESGTAVWVIDCGDLEIVPGGNIF